MFIRLPGIPKSSGDAFIFGRRVPDVKSFEGPVWIIKPMKQIDISVLIYLKQMCIDTLPAICHIFNHFARVPAS
jgi:hypothetical protein